jgi:hypothetical protein
MDNMSTDRPSCGDFSAAGKPTNAAGQASAQDQLCYHYSGEEENQLMRFAMICPVLLSLLSACSKPVPPIAPAGGQVATAPMVTAASPVLSLNGFGSVRFGTRLSEVERQLGAKAEPLGDSDPACSSVRFRSLPGARLMVESGVVTRADADTGTPNSLGLAVGDTLERARKDHQGLEMGPHKYLPTGHYLTFPSPDGSAAIILEVDESVITKIRAGLQPAVGYVEVCL